MPARTIYAVETHDQVFEIWKQNRLQALHVLHLDFHCDLRGMLIDRESHRAYRIWDRFSQLDEGNFLTHAVAEGIVRRIRWVHDDPGGRKDDLKTVKYCNDASAQLHRLALFLKRDSGYPIQYEVIDGRNWTGIEAGEVLDIDWDFFASREYSRDSIQRRLEAFWSREFEHIPEQTFVCYSRSYSHPTRNQFEDFVQQLATRFDARIIDVAHPAQAAKPSPLRSKLTPVYQTARQIYHTLCLALRKRGIY